MTGKRKHFAAEPHELDPIPLIPAEHLNEIAGIGKTQRLDICQTSRDICGLIPVWTILDRMRRSRRMLEGMAVR